MWRVVAALTLAFGALFATPANALQLTDNSVQFTYYWQSHSVTFTDCLATITVTNNITNKIGGNGEVIDSYRIRFADDVIEVTEKHDARDYDFVISGSQTIVLEGIDRGFWAGYYGPIMSWSCQTFEAVTEPSTESEEVTESPSTESEPVTESPITESELVTESEVVTESPMTESTESATISPATESPAIEPEPQPEPEPSPQPQPEPQPQPAPEPTPEPVIEPTESPITESTESPVTESPVSESEQPEQIPQSTASAELSVSPPSLPQTLPPIAPPPTSNPPSQPTLAPNLPDEVKPSESEQIEAPTSSTPEIIEVPETDEPETLSGPVQAIGAVISAFANAGLDMTPEQREKAQGVVIPSVIAAQVATLAMRRIK